MGKKKDKFRFLSNITRRDFISGSLIGAGSALLYANAPWAFSKSSKKQRPNGIFNDPWTGFGGVGDYGVSNGNVASTRDAAHLVRDVDMEELLSSTEQTSEEYDMVIIGGGFSGIGAAYEFYKKYGDTKKCLILENHPVFGGEAKLNEFDVDGYRIFAPQGSNDFGLPNENNRFSWSGKEVPSRHEDISEYGQYMYVTKESDIEIRYDYFLDKRKNKEKIIPKNS